MEQAEINPHFIERNLLQSRSGVSETLLDLYCKERALEDCMLGLRDKDLSLSEMLKVMRQLSKKQYKVQNKIKKLYAFHQSNAV